MIQMTWGQIRNTQFLDALGQLKGLPMPFKLGYSIGKITTKVEAELKLAQTEFVKLVGKWADIDEAGNYKVKEGNEEVFQKEMTEFFGMSFTIDKNKINIAEFPQDIKMSAVDIIALEPILFGLEALEGGLDEKSSKEESSQEDRKES